LKIHLYEVDLRWGVTEAEAQANNSLSICLEEIDRARPLFIGFFLFFFLLFLHFLFFFFLA